MFKVYYQPPATWFGDCMPFYKDGWFYLFHQRDTRRPAPFGEPFGWSLVKTRDFAGYEDLGEVLPPGGVDDPDQFLFSGTVFEVAGRYYAMYTGYNRDYAQRGLASQSPMLAMSDDLVHWTKRGHPAVPLPPGYDPHDWRDPFVFWDENEGVHVLVLGARKIDGARNLTGRTVYFTSRDLRDWEFRGDLWAPGLYSMHEMPDLFRIGSLWYLLTTEYSERNRTVYRISESWRGPWSSPMDDAFDGRAYYAARTASDGLKRFLFGWVPTREGDDDLGDWQWGGTLVVHELDQRQDGSLGVAIPDSVASAFTRPLPVDRSTLISTVAVAERSLATETGDCFLLEMTIRFSPRTRKFGIRLFEDPATGVAYEFAIRPLERRLAFDRTGTYHWNTYNGKGLERYLDLSPGVEHRVQVVVDGPIATAYVEGTGLNARMCAKSGSALGFDVVDGEVEILSAALKQR